MRAADHRLHRGRHADLGHIGAAPVTTALTLKHTAFVKLTHHLLRRKTGYRRSVR